MDIDFHVPVSDLRLLASEAIGRRRRPTWPFGNVTADPGRSEFLPGFGPLKKTPLSSTGDWEGRSQYVPADRAVRFPDSLAAQLRTSMKQQGPRPGRETFDVSCLNRRYFGSVKSVRSLLEISLEVRNLQPYSWEEIVTLVHALLDMKVRVAQGKPGPLMHMSTELATFVRQSTTVAHFDGRAPSWLVVGADIQCVMTLDQDPEGALPSDATRVGDVDSQRPGSSLHYLRREDCDIWFFVEPDLIRRRTTRLYLSRLHAERAAFIAILRGLVRSERDPRAIFTAESEPVRQALSECLAYLDRNRSHGHSQRPLLEALEWDLDVHGDQWDALERHIAKLPDQTQSRLTQFVINYDLRNAQAVQIGNDNTMDSHFAGNRAPDTTGTSG